MNEELIEKHNKLIDLLIAITTNQLPRGLTERQKVMLLQALKIKLENQNN